MNEATLKHAFNVQHESKQTKGKDIEQSRVTKAMNDEILEVTITRKPNYGQQYLKGLPITKIEREKLKQVFTKIENAITNRYNMYIEDIRDLLQEISSLSFEFPRHKLEGLFEVVNEKLF